MKTGDRKTCEEYKAFLREQSAAKPEKEDDSLVASVEAEEKEMEVANKVLDVMIDLDPFKNYNLLFKSLITKTKTGQALVFKGVYGPRGKERDVAIKMFTSKQPFEFYHEVEVMTTIPAHKNVLTLVDYFIASNNKIRVVVLPLAKYSLDHLYISPAPISPATIKKYMRQVAKGLAHMHNNNVAHLDMKCGNVLIGNDDNCMICDFGFTSRLMSTRKRFKAALRGTPPFMAPEVHNETVDSDLTKIDIYAFGMMIYELLVGDLPWARLDRGNWHEAIRAEVVAGRRPGVDK